MRVPYMSEAERIERLTPPVKKVRMVLDTDTYNEIDDQFAVAYALLSSERISVEAVYAAPFANERSSGPGDGMEKSYQEILRLLDRMDISPEGLVLRGSKTFLPTQCAFPKPHPQPVESEAAIDLVERAMALGHEPLYVAAIGAITNVASAILMEPRIVKRVVVVWLGGEPLYWPHTCVFNVAQDIAAARVIFDSGVPLVHIPCSCVASHLLTSLAELERCIKGTSRIGDYLTEIFEAYHPDHFGWAKEIWDISAIAWLINPEWVPTELVHSPVLTDQVTWSEDRSRHLIRNATFAHRNPIFQDLFTKLAH